MLSLVTVLKLLHTTYFSMSLAGLSIEISLSLPCIYQVQMFLGAGIPRAVTSVEDSIGVMQALFAPFPETTFPRTLDATSLAGLMAAPFACRVPLPQSQYQHARRLFPDLFCPETTTSAHDLHPFLVTALQASWPTGTPTELLLTSFWDTVGYRLPELAAGHLGLPVSQNRSVGISLSAQHCYAAATQFPCLMITIIMMTMITIVDSPFYLHAGLFRDSVDDDSITIADKKRDYMLFLDNALVIGGEDRPMRGEMYVAQSELLEKHKGANAALYGDLGYIIMIATAGKCARVFALDVRQGAHLQLLVEEFEVRPDKLLSFGLL